MSKVRVVLKSEDGSEQVTFRPYTIEQMMQHGEDLEKLMKLNAEGDQTPIIEQWQLILRLFTASARRTHSDITEERVSKVVDMGDVEIITDLISGKMPKQNEGDSEAENPSE